MSVTHNWLLITFISASCFAQDQIVTLVAKQDCLSSASCKPNILKVSKNRYIEHEQRFTQIIDHQIDSPIFDDIIFLACTPLQLELIQQSLEILDQDNCISEASIEDLINRFNSHKETHTIKTTELLCTNFLLAVLNKYQPILNQKSSDHDKIRSILNKINDQLDIKSKYRGVSICSGVGTVAALGAAYMTDEVLSVFCKAVLFNAAWVTIGSLLLGIQWEPRPIVDRILEILDGKAEDFGNLYLDKTCHR